MLNTEYYACQVLYCTIETIMYMCRVDAVVCMYHTHASYIGPDGAPQNVEVAMYEKGILVTWLPPPGETHNGPLTGYTVSLCEVCMCVFVCL